MFRNYIIITFRSLRKNGVYTFINVAGLATGLACSILILLWVNHELSFDGFHEKKQHLHKIMVNGLRDNGIQTGPAIPMPLEAELKKDPGIKHTALTNWGETYLLTVNDKKIYKQGYYVGEDFLKMFSFPLQQGSAETALKDLSSIVISESTAEALFGQDDPMGKVVRLNNLVDLKVTGVTSDVSSNSTFQFDCLVPWSTYLSNESWVKNSQNEWGNYSFNLYVELHDYAKAEQVHERIKNVIKAHEDEGSTAEVILHPITRWRLYSEFENGQSQGGLIEYVRMFTLIAVFILVIACINFMNLATARSEKRAREVGIRKSVGSNRRELVIQFLGESVFITFLAFLISVGVVEICLPLYNNLVDKNLFIDYGNVAFWTIAVGIIFATGIIAGSYPAFYLSGFRPAAVLKGKMHAGKSGVVPRKVLVTLQFVFSIFLIVSTLAVYLQLNHLKNRPTGYDRENLLMVQSTGDIPTNTKLIKQELIDKNLASYVTTSSSPITSIYAFMGGVKWEGKRDDQRTPIATVATEYDYAKTMGIEIIQGRDFSEEFNDTTSMILNESFVNYAGIKNPLEEKINWNDHDYKIVGVFKDVVMTSPNSPPHPTMFIFDPTWISEVNIRLPEKSNVHQVLAGIQSIFEKHNPAYPFTYRFADDEFNKKFTDIQRIGRLANLFALLAILISCLGLFGLSAFTAEQRTKEFGIRKVLGATASQVVILITKDFSKLIVIAFVVAAPIGWWAMNQWLLKYEYRITLEWWVPAMAGMITLALGLATVSFQAVKAAVGNPATALRNE
jgi:ABC-type antimicrobial peptide transport system permease subunit